MNFDIGYWDLGSSFSDESPNNQHTAEESQNNVCQIPQAHCAPEPPEPGDSRFMATAFSKVNLFSYFIFVS